MKRILFFLATVGMVFSLAAQGTTDTKPVLPFKIKDRILSGLDVPQMKLSDHPEREYFQKRIYHGTDLSIFVLASETADNEISNFPIDEFVYYLNGRADITPEGAAPFSFFAGDYLFVPKGFSGTWTNNGGNKYHLELSVITTQRSGNAEDSEAKVPFLLDRALLSGIGLTAINDREYEDVLYTGVELVALTKSEVSTERKIESNPTDQLIHVLNGMVTITPIEGQAAIYSKGDFFVLPRAFSGDWKSEGQHLFRALIIKPV